MTGPSPGGSRPTVSIVADGLGMVASAVCALHCILAPSLVVAGTVLPAVLLRDEWFHQAMVWVILPAALVAFGLGCWRHKDRWVLGLGALGLVGIALSVSALHDVIGEAGERVVTLGSATILIAAHYRNFKLCRTDRCKHDGR